MKRLVHGAALAFAVSTATACTSFTVQGGQALAGYEKSPKCVEATHHGSLWGFGWSGSDVIDCGDACRAIHHVEIHTDVVDILTSLLTVGIYVPQTVEYECFIDRPSDDGTDADDSVE